MAFGKLFIRAEHGDTQEFTLTKPSTTIGRQPGNDLVLNTTAVSRYHARIDVVDGQVVLVDLGSENGTFVNDVQLPRGGSSPLSQGDKIGIGDRLLIYTSPQARGRLDINLAPTPTIVEADDLPFRMVIDEPQQLVAPGARLQIVLVLINNSERDLPLVVTSLGLDESWVHIDQPNLLIEPEKQAQVIVTVLPPRLTTTRPGRYALTIRAADIEDPNKMLEAVREIDVVGYSGLEMQARPGEKLNTTFIAIHNDGNIPLDLDLGGYTHGKLLDFEFVPEHVVAAPGEMVRSVLTVSARDPKRGDLPQQFAVVARSRDAAAFYAPLQGVYTPVPKRRRAWPAAIVMFLLAGLLLSAGLVGGAWWMGLWPFDGRGTGTPEAAAITETPTLPPGPTPTLVEPPQPTAITGAQIEAFRVSGGEAVYRTEGDLTFTWRITGDEAEGGFISLEDPNQPGGSRLLRLEGLNGTTAFPIAQLTPGNHNFRLVVVDATGRQIAEQVAGVSVEATACRVLNASVPVRTLPEAEADEVDTPRTSSEVFLAGRTDEADWLWVAYGDLDALNTFGWLPASEINCPPGVPVEDIVVVPPEGDPLLLESTPPGEPDDPTATP